MGQEARKRISWGLMAAVVAFSLAMPAAHAANYTPGTTVVVFVHGVDPDGYNRVGVFGDDEANPSVLDDVNSLAATLGQPTWQTNPTAPNHVAGSTYYGNTPPSWYTSADIAADAAAAGQVPRYALRMAKYIRHCLNRAPGATGVNICSGSFGTDVTRYMLEHNLMNLCSDGLVARWNTIVGVVRGNWPASNFPDWLAALLGADSPDLDDMRYDWITANISNSGTMNSTYFAPMLITHFMACYEGNGALTTLCTAAWANDGTNLVSDEYFAGYSSTSVLHAATDGTLQMPGTSYQSVAHSDIVNSQGMWAGVAAASQNNMRVTVKISRFKALTTGDGWLQGKGEFAFGVTGTSPMAATLYNLYAPISNIPWTDGVLPLYKLSKNETTYPNLVVFDQILPQGETQLNVGLTLMELDNYFKFYKVVETGANDLKGTWTATITGEGTIALSNGNAQVDLTTTVKLLY